VKVRGLKYVAKTFTLPDAQVGRIIEYRYISWTQYMVYDSRWILSEDLFTKDAKFSLKKTSKGRGKIRTGSRLRRRKDSRSVNCRLRCVDYPLGCYHSKTAVQGKLIVHTWTFEI
jgi:hypothetical protein